MIDTVFIESLPIFYGNDEAEKVGKTYNSDVPSQRVKKGTSLPGVETFKVETEFRVSQML